MSAEASSSSSSSDSSSSSSSSSTTSTTTTPNTLIVILGAGGSGKDYLRDALVKQGRARCISCTSRPIREGETEGVHYYFLQRDAFLLREARDYFAETDEFQGNLYGLALEEVDREGGVAILTLNGLLKLIRQYKANIFTVFLDIPEDIRRTRLMSRKGSVKELVEERLQTDAVKNAQLKDSLCDLLVDVVFADPVFPPDETAAYILQLVEAYTAQQATSTSAFSDKKMKLYSQQKVQQTAHVLGLPHTMHL